MKFHHEAEASVITAVSQFAKSVKSNKNMAESMMFLTDATSQIPLSRLDNWERLIRETFSEEIEKKYKWLPLKQKERFLTWIDIISWDGYKREKALRTLTGPAPNSFFFAMLLRRLNDWVPEVRTAARDKLPIIIENSNPVFVVDAISSTLTNWKSWGRMKELDKQALFNLLANNHIFDTLLNHIVSSHSGPVMYLLTQCGRNQSIDAHLSRIAKNAIQPSVRAKAYRNQLEGKVKWQEGREWKWIDKVYGEGRFVPTIAERELTEIPAFEATLEAASIDRSSAVRRVAAEFHIRDIDQMSKHAAMKYAQLFEKDISPTVSERGKFALRHINSGT